MNLKIDTSRIQVIVIVSLGIFLWKAIDLMILGNPYLMPLAVLMSLGICYSWFYKKRVGIRFTKAWGIILIIYPILRSLLAFVISLDLGGVEAYIVNQINIWFYITNLIILGSGILILKKRKVMWDSLVNEKP